MNERITKLAIKANDETGNLFDLNHKELNVFLEKFAELIAAEERNRIWTQSHWTEYERKIVAAEREACAGICDLTKQMCEAFGKSASAAKACADAIRARGNE
jgi:DNA mismatch repair ATPase MutS